MMHQVTHCPFCGSDDVEQTTVQNSGVAYTAKRCPDCGDTFKVTVPVRNTSVEWSTVR